MKQKKIALIPATEPVDRADPSSGVLVRKALAGLKKRVAGYDATERKTTYEPAADGQQSVKSEIATTKHYPPDLNAIEFVLTNLDPQRWSAKPVATTGETPSERATPDLSQLSDRALRELLDVCPEISATP